MYLRDIVEASRHIAQFVTGLDRAGFQSSELVRSSVVQKVAVIGEAAAHLPDELKARHLEEPWPRIVAFRNILVHAYFGIDWDLVWRAANKESPFLRTQIEMILRSEFGGA